ncbi:MAG: glycosyltransferase [Deltaproteobacteria bacterium]
MEVIYSKYNRERLPEFQIETTIFKEDKRLYAKKKALTPEAVSHIKSMNLNYSLLMNNYKNVQVAPATLKDDDIIFDYIQGKAFDALMAEAVIVKDKIGFLNLLNKYLDFVKGLGAKRIKSFKACKRFCEIFGSELELEDVLCIEPANIDLIFDNIIIDNKNRYWIIDYEWVFDFPIPLDFIIFRSINIFSAKYINYFKDFISIKEIYENAGISDEMIKVFEGFESSFQEYVFGKKKICVIKEDYLKLSETVSNLENDLSLKSKRIEEQAVRLKQLERITIGLYEQIEQNELVIEQKEKIIEEKIEMAEEIEKKVYEKDNEIEEKEIIIKEKEILINEKADKIQQYERVIDEKKNVAIQLTEELKCSQRHIKEENAKIQELMNKEKQLDIILNSRAWGMVKRYYRAKTIMLPPNSTRILIIKIFFGAVKHPIKFFKSINTDNIKKFLGYIKRKESLAGKLEKYHSTTFLNKKLQIQIFKKADKKKELLVFNKEENPLVSIIIPVYNQWEYTYSCLRSIFENTQDIAYEILIADDVSIDETVNITDYVENIIVIRNSENKGFILNCNNAAVKARGKYILLLNNDTNVQKDWLKHLVELTENNERIGMVGSKLVYPDGKLQEAGGIIWRDGSGWNYGRMENPQKPEYCYVKEVDYISGASILIKKSLWDEIGGFDERYVPAYYDDSDLAFEVRKKGYQVIYQPKSVVVHFEGISHGTDTSQGLKAYQKKNREKFIKKWKGILEQEHFGNGENVFWARDRSRNKKTVLVIDHYVPHYDKDAGSRTTFQYIKLFVEMGFNVKFIGDNFCNHEPYTGTLQSLGVEVLYGEWYRDNYEKWIKENADKIDYVYLNRPHISIKYIDIIKKHLRAKIIYYGHDLHSLREKREYELSKDEWLLRSFQKWEKIEYELIKKADIIYYPSQVEINHIKNLFPDICAKAIPAYIFENIYERKMQFDQKRNLLFVGGFSHRPNIDAALWFIKDIFPYITRNIPDIKVFFVGSNPTQEILKLKSDNVIVTGYVTDEELEEYYDKCRLVIAPLRYGAGIKGKIVEAIYYQVPVVTTAIGAEGLQDIEEILMIEDSSCGFAKSVINLYDDISLLEELSLKCLDYIQKNFSKEYVKKVIINDMKP